MNHPSTTSDGARHIDAFIDALARRHRRLARLTLLTRAALVVALIWVAAVGAWFLVARESTSAQTLLVAAALAASVAAAVLAWRRQGPPPTRARLARLAEDRLSGLDDRLATAVDVLERNVAGRRWAHRPAAARRHRAARQPRTTSSWWCRRPRCAARRTGPPPRSARSPSSRLWPASRWVAPGRAVRLWAFPERLALEVSPGDARVKPGVAVYRARDDF